MKTVRRTEDRRCDRRSGRQVWHTFFEATDGVENTRQFGALEALDEDVRTKGARPVRHRHADAELFTYVAEGALRYEDTSGREGLIAAGEFSRRRTHRGGVHRDANASLEDPLRAFVMRLRAAPCEFTSDLEQRRVTNAERRGRLQAVGSHDPHTGSVHLQQDATIYSAVLDAGQHVAHALRPGRIAWLHVVHGAVRMDELTLLVGDGVGVMGERSISVTALSASEVLLVDVDDGEPRVCPATMGPSSATPVVHRPGENGASAPASTTAGWPRTSGRASVDGGAAWWGPNARHRSCTESSA
jgi:redox-sensitive bicupin YhaK (pirin superfamily)